ncbi:exo-rhamnogalacturonase B [Auricularia subglabra TFB-10046 SS5]|nr:exo-rhamnogalacturonase B [Auricularia subglabra TFB-10046 SS5]
MQLPILPLFLSATAILTSRAALSVPDNAYWTNLAHREHRRLCMVRPDPDGGDDAPAIERALNRDCRSKSLVVFPAPQYKIATIMNTTQLDDVVIHQYGRMLWTPDVDYWLTVSEYVGYRNQSTVWFFGGERVVWDGHGVGTLDGNGQVWYNWARGRSNLPRRPMNINFRGFNNSVVRGMNFVQSQMWTMALMWSRNVLMEDIYVNNTSTRQGEVDPLNTDGFDSLYAGNVTLSRWRVVSGDDAIALKANSTNIFVYDSEIWGGSGFAVGSVAQYPGNYEVVENFVVRNVTMHRTRWMAYFKSWTGNPHGYPPNGGGGGFGYARNAVFEDITFDHINIQPFYIIQCINFEGHEGEDCDSSQFHFDNIVWRRVRGTTTSSVRRAGYFNCSGKAGGCNNITVTDVDIRTDGTGEPLKKFECHNVNGTVGFECTDFF